MITITLEINEVPNSGGSVRVAFKSPPSPEATESEKQFGFNIIAAIREVSQQNGGVELGGN